MTTLYESLSWRRLSIPADSATGAVDIRVGEGGDAGPTAFLCAGVHGDEGPWGGLALREVLALPRTRLTGRICVVLAANPLAAQADARNAPLDGLDLNRSFPGSSQGSHTEHLAATLAPLIAASDVVVDLHGGGSWCVNAFVFRFKGSEALAAQVAAPFVVDVPEKEGTLTQYAKSHGAQVVAIEMGGRSRDELLWKERIASSVARVLSHMGVLAADPAARTPLPALAVGPSTVLRPERGGVFVPTLREDAVGTVVEEGTELGRLCDLHTLEHLQTFTAPFPKTALLLLRPHIGVIEGGAMTYVVAEPKLK
ncbi:succinylglutamate desuccinylase/aspartoacylase family protein [soil metagenome]